VGDVVGRLGVVDGDVTVADAVGELVSEEHPVKNKQAAAVARR
jgi:hypothetical protein